MFMYDLPNLLVLLTFIFIIFRLGFIPFWLSFFLGIFSFIPFFLNDVLFPATLMSDQFGYLEATQYARSFEEGPPFKPTHKFVAAFFSMIPLPYVETIQSLGFFNRLLATLIIIWLYASKKLRGWPLLFVLFYPSFLLYSSLALRDTIVVLFMIVSVILFIDRRRVSSILISLPLLLIKFQNFFLIIVFFIVHLTFSKDSLFYRLRFILLPLILLAITPFINDIVQSLDFYRYAFHVDDGGDPTSYKNIQSLQEFAIISIQSAPYFLLKPLPWEASNFLQLIQSFENLLIAGFCIFLLMKAYRINKMIAVKWMIFLIISFAIYGLVIFNFGTAARYKFPFLIVFVVGIAYELYLKNNKFILNRRVRN